ncbi:MAG: chemotaxis protein CheA [Victivallales bacterium]|nr:chemotaxis protein CheA [Victivallales bacterium]
MEDFELLESFVSESNDLIDDVEPLFIQLEKAAGGDQHVDVDVVNKIFRLFHSMKGSAGFIGLNNIAKVTHHAETLLDAFRKNPELPMTSYFLEVQLQAIDAIRTMLENTMNNGNDEGLEDLRDTVVDRLVEALEVAEGGAPPEEAPKKNKETAKSEKAAEKKAPAESKKTKKQEDLERENIRKMIESEGGSNFFHDGLELLEKTEECLLQYQKADEKKQKELVNEAFRLLHNFKGSCGFLKYEDLAKLSHAAESILECVKSGKIELDEQTLEILLQAVDTLTEGMNVLTQNGNSAEIPNCELMVEFLNDISGATPLNIDELALPDEQEAPAATSEQKSEDQPQADFDDMDLPDDVKALLMAEESGSDEEDDDKASFLTAGGSKQSPMVAEIRKIDKSSQEQKDVIPAKPLVKTNNDEMKKAAAAQPPQKEFAQTIRVDLKRLDKLINLVGELVIAESMVFRVLTELLGNDNDLERKIHHLQRVSSELQDVAMSVRMIPLSATFKKMIRLIHDLSKKSSKKVDMKLIGEDTEVDKNVIEQINDPLVHIIRNSVDHGIETAEERIAAGKPETGMITLEAKHEGGEVWISIIDDGHGLNRDKILGKAIERGLVSGDGSEMTDDDVFQLIFEPGFSTADKVTDISGRGVGMDVVKKNIEKLNGRIKVRSKAGHGTTISLRIPLTLAIIDGMLVKIGDSLFTVPLLAIRESIRGTDDMLIGLPDGNECINVRHEEIPIIKLYSCFRRSTEITEIKDGVLVIVEADGQKAALLVDEIVGQQEIVIKGLSTYLGAPKGISGCTVLGNGEVSLIIDISSLLSRVS